MEKVPGFTTVMPDDIYQRGEAIYSRLKDRLEAEHDREYVTIHVDTEEYATARNGYLSGRALWGRTNFPIDGRLFTRKIGSEPDTTLEAMTLFQDKYLEERRK